jgi:hypothetical protein
MRGFIFAALLLFTSRNLQLADRGIGPEAGNTPEGKEVNYTTPTFKPGSWQYFLQHLPVKEGAVLDYQGNPVPNQAKAAMIINYDVGNKNLQQCADALIRLRAEYLFAAQRYQEIAFNFTSGHLFAFNDYCKGMRPVVNGNRVSFSPLSAMCEPSHAALRRYLDIVYAYAGTISLSRALRPVSGITVGTVIITAGSPGHCSIVVDESTTGAGGKVYKLAESFMPAQSIYILRNTKDPGMGFWHPLKKDITIETASYIFENYKLGSFE